MQNDRFKIPLPDDREIDRQIKLITEKGVVQRETFVSYMRTLVAQVGWRHLFADRLQLGIVFMGIVLGLSSLLVIPPLSVDVHNLYAAVFLLSPILFLAFSILTYVHKTQNATYDVEMACKYNVYQIIAFRMLAFSVLSMFVNTVWIAAMAVRFEAFDFGQAFLLSGTSLFLFSFLLTFALLNRRTKGIVVTAIVLWISGNMSARSVSTVFYNEVLMNLPFAVYAAVLLGCLILYMNYLNKLIGFKQPEGEW